jgi:glycine/D-amino acid oxidase-like deaminating enzyme
LFDELVSVHDFPVQLVRGQSVELETRLELESALLCGKYISPLDSNLILVGATHEFLAQAMSRDQVIAELRERTHEMMPSLWDTSLVRRVTSGVRVQSERGKYGRLPIIGRIPSTIHPYTWIFTGLSSRGILYHGLYGQILAEAILYGGEEPILTKFPDLMWWK